MSNLRMSVKADAGDVSVATLWAVGAIFVGGAVFVGAVFGLLYFLAQSPYYIW